MTKLISAPKIIAIFAVLFFVGSVFQNCNSSMRLNNPGAESSSSDSMAVAGIMANVSAASTNWDRLTDEQIVADVVSQLESILSILRLDPQMSSAAVQVESYILRLQTDADFRRRIIQALRGQSATPTPVATATPVTSPTPALSPTPFMSPTPVTSPTPVASTTPFLSPTPMTSATPVSTSTPVTSPTPAMTPSSNAFRCEMRSGEYLACQPSTGNRLPLEEWDGAGTSGALGHTATWKASSEAECRQLCETRYPEVGNRRWCVAVFVPESTYLGAAFVNCRLFTDYTCYAGPRNYVFTEGNHPAVAGGHCTR